VEDTQGVVYLGQIPLSDLKSYFNSLEEASEAISDVLVGLIGDWPMERVGILQASCQDARGIQSRYAFYRQAYLSYDTISKFTAKNRSAKDFEDRLEALYEVLCYAGGAADKICNKGFLRFLKNKKTSEALRTMVESRAGFLYSSSRGKIVYLNGLSGDDRLVPMQEWIKEMFRYAMSDLRASQRTPQALLRWLESNPTEKALSARKCLALKMALASCGDQFSLEDIKILQSHSVFKSLVLALEQYFYQEVLDPVPVKMVSVRRDSLEWTEDGTLCIPLNGQMVQIRIPQQEGRFRLSDRDKAAVAAQILTLP
jgi:hypothetical protein